MNFLKRNRQTFFVLLLCYIIFLSVFALYHLPLSAALYPLILCTILVLGVLFYNDRRQRQLLLELKAALKAKDPHLPGPEDELQAAYSQIIEELKTRAKEERKLYRRRSKESEDTVALWIHQIKTPITSLKLILETNESPPGSKSQLFKIEQYLEMILNYFRLESDETDYVFRRVDLDTLIKAEVKKFAPEFILRKNAIDLKPTGLTPVTDEKWFSFVLGQILSNSLKYTKNGTVKIYAEENTLVIEDDGIGITAADLPRIFERGYTGYNGRDQKNASGLGLYLCKRVLDELDVKVRVDSAPGIGTKVSLGF